MPHINSSSSISGSSLHPPHNNSSNLLIDSCFTTETNTLVYVSFLLTYISLLPAVLLAFYLGYQRWKKNTLSHSDVFAIHASFMQLIDIFGYSLFVGGGYAGRPRVLWTGLIIEMISYSGLTALHLLTCVERYLAVVHPIKYLQLKQPCGVKIRNFTIGCVWAFSFGCVSKAYITNKDVDFLLEACGLVTYFIIVSVCSISVLCELKRGKKMQKVDRAKKRAFFTIVLISGLLLARFTADILFSVSYNSEGFGPHARCVVITTSMWFVIPSGMVLPVMFLHRAGKLGCCKKSTTTNTGSK